VNPRCLKGEDIFDEGEFFRARIWRHLRPQVCTRNAKTLRAQRQEVSRTAAYVHDVTGLRALGVGQDTTRGVSRGRSFTSLALYKSVHTTRRWAGREGLQNCNCIAIQGRKGRNSPVFRVRDPPRRDYKSGMIPMPALADGCSLGRRRNFPPSWMIHEGLLIIPR